MSIKYSVCVSFSFSLIYQFTAIENYRHSSERQSTCAFETHFSHIINMSKSFGSFTIVCFKSFVAFYFALVIMLNIFMCMAVFSLFLFFSLLRNKFEQIRIWNNFHIIFPRVIHFVILCTVQTTANELTRTKPISFCGESMDFFHCCFCHALFFLILTLLDISLEL